MRLYKFVEMATMLVATARTSIIAATIFSLEVDTPWTFLKTMAAGNMNAMETVVVDPKN